MPTGPPLPHDENLVRALLDRYEPFDRMRTGHRRLLEEEGVLQRAAKGDVLLAPDDGPVQVLLIVLEGKVEGRRGNAETGTETVSLLPGQSFPLGALLGERATRTIYTAADDVRYLRVPNAVFAQLFRDSGVFRDYCIRNVSSLLEQVQQHLQATAIENLGTGSRFDTPLGELTRSPAVSCPPELPIREAVARMHERKVGSIVVVDSSRRPQGIFTLHDLRERVAAGVDLDAPVSAAMTPEPFTLSAETLAFDAVLLMARHRIRHVVVTRDATLAGVISERDLFALQRINVVQLMRGLSQARDVDELAAARGGIHVLIEAMMAHGAGIEQITRIITLLNDRTAIRAIELCTSDSEALPSFTWLAFGSEGRAEQTLLTDQDNGILFDPRDEHADDARRRLLPVAQRINQALDRCGFPLCKGNVMAGNPALCLSESEWRATFDTLIRTQTPENLLRSSIYFDFRSIRGDDEAVSRLREHVLKQASGTSLFQHMMAANALRNHPPLGLIRDFITERSDEAAGETLDLKLRGLTPFVDGARLLSLEGALPETNTLERFAAVAETGLATRDEASAWSESFAFIQMTRMHLHLRQARRGEPMNNRLDPYALNPMDRHILKEAFRQCRALQKKLEVRYQVR